MNSEDFILLNDSINDYLLALREAGRAERNLLNLDNNIKFMNTRERCLLTTHTRGLRLFFHSIKNKSYRVFPRTV